MCALNHFSHVHNVQRAARAFLPKSLLLQRQKALNYVAFSRQSSDTALFSNGKYEKEGRNFQNFGLAFHDCFVLHFVCYMDFESVSNK